MVQQPVGKVLSSEHIDIIIFRRIPYHLIDRTCRYKYEFMVFVFFWGLLRNGN